MELGKFLTSNELASICYMWHSGVEILLDCHWLIYIHKLFFSSPAAVADGIKELIENDNHHGAVLFVNDSSMMIVEDEMTDKYAKIVFKE